MDKVGHFEVPADDLERAKKFYNTVFEWQIHPMPEADFHHYHSAITTKREEAHGINGGLYKRTRANEPTTIVVEVDSIEDYLKKVIKAGGSVVLEKQHVAESGFYARVQDTEGNLIGLWQAAN
ncbi:Glyoxalase/bleomycin resistance protein/dioxygenase [Chlamydiales bacterium STE3]|nr:Glyoxalase/bleomycin resistance protein/dioxygenase [Chlamydiales bacterium STE3]